MIYYITTHQKSFHYAKKVKELFENQNCEYYFVYGLGNDMKLDPYIEVPCIEAYANLPVKTFHIIEHFLKTDHPYMFKMDDDTFINVELINKAKFSADYIGMFFEYPQDLRSSVFHWYNINDPAFHIQKKTFKLFYAEGGGYILSRKAAQTCFNAGQNFFENTPENYLGEDTKIGMCLEGDDIIRLDLMSNEGLDYEVTENLDIIHPVHFLLFDKLKKVKTPEEKRKILIQYNYLNNNVKRNIYLQNLVKTLK